MLKTIIPAAAASSGRKSSEPLVAPPWLPYCAGRKTSTAALDLARVVEKKRRRRNSRLKVMFTPQRCANLQEPEIVGRNSLIIVFIYFHFRYRFSGPHRLEPGHSVPASLLACRSCDRGRQKRPAPLPAALERRK